MGDILGVYVCMCVCVFVYIHFPFFLYLNGVGVTKPEKGVLITFCINFTYTEFVSVWGSIYFLFVLKKSSTLSKFIS